MTAIGDLFKHSLVPLDEADLPCTAEMLAALLVSRHDDCTIDSSPRYGLGVRVVFTLGGDKIGYLILYPATDIIQLGDFYHPASWRGTLHPGVDTWVLKTKSMCHQLGNIQGAVEHALGILPELIPVFRSKIVPHPDSPTEAAKTIIQQLGHVLPVHILIDKHGCVVVRAGHFSAGYALKIPSAVKELLQYVYSLGESGLRYKIKVEDSSDGD